MQFVRSISVYFAKGGGHAHLSLPLVLEFDPVTEPIARLLSYLRGMKSPDSPHTKYRQLHWTNQVIAFIPHMHPCGLEHKPPWRIINVF